MKGLVLLTITLALSSVEPDFNCQLCHESLKSIHLYSKHQDNYSYLIQLAKDLCVQYGEPTWFEICNQLIDVFKQVVIDALMDKIFDHEYVCKVLGHCSGPHYIKEDFEFYMSSVMRNKPSRPAKGNLTDTYKFVQVSDIHIDLEYRQGTVGDCGIPQCCRKGEGDAGKWGGFNCDLPLGTLQAALEQIKDMSPDFVVITGDFPPHDVWSQSKQSNLHYQSVVAETFQRILPNTKLLPIYGNHACYPINQCKLGKDNWIAKPFVEAWNLPLRHLESLQYRGGYSEKIGSNLRVIALDTNTDNCGNLQISKNSTNPLGQLTWLYLQLLDAEKNNEKVLIFGHISPGDPDALGTWGKHFEVLMDRFEYTVTGQLYGHSHIDQIHINKGVYDKSKATSIQWVAPSLTTYTNNNPAFRVFEADLYSHRLVEIYQYRMDLVERNKFNDRPVWELAYKFTELYGVLDIDPETVLGIGNQMENDLTTVNIYRTQAYGNGINKDCDIDCRNFFHCSVTQGVISDIIACQGFSEEGLLSTFLQQFFTEWTYKVT